MSDSTVKLPDVGEGVAEAELIEWHVAVGDTVTTESVLAEVMTDKATVEISSPVAAWCRRSTATGRRARRRRRPDRDRARPPAAPVEPVTPRQRVLAAPAVRTRAAQLGIELGDVTGSGPDGRVVHADLDRHLLAGRTPAGASGTGSERVDEQPIRGLRRQIADRLTATWREVPHITYVEAVDATELEALRAELNRRGHPSEGRLTLLPFVARAVALACREQPRINARYDSESQTLSVVDSVHLGIATQTPDGLMVPVVRHVERRSLWDLAGAIATVADAAREGRATREQLSGSTITITSLGALGGVVTTPIVNRPEVAIIGVNKLQTTPVWRNGGVEPRQVLNLSSSFDHRIVDGWDAATFVQRIRSLLEMPALLFVDDEA
jgi:2-oxoisovalerate dehydrogenase E2 component (dihydrolipoyl transacylase)